MDDKKSKHQAAGRPFYLRVRRCLVCGRILTNPEAVRVGYGCRCGEKIAIKNRGGDASADVIPGQISIAEYLMAAEKEEKEERSDA